MTAQTGVGVGPRSQLLAWLDHHRQAARLSLLKIFSAPLASGLTVTVIAIALALPAVLALGMSQFSQLVDQREEAPQLTLLLGADVSADEAQVLAKTLNERPDIIDVRLITKDMALKKFVADSGLEDLAGTMTDNPLPHTLWIFPTIDTRPSGVKRLGADLESFERVDRAVVDSLWLQRFDAILALGNQISKTLGFLMAVGTVLVLGNTLRLDIANRREEIVVIKLIGGGDNYTRRPFLYSGFWFGLSGGILAWIFVLTALSAINLAVDDLLHLYNSTFILELPSGNQVLILAGSGSLLGLISGWYVTKVYLREIEPR